MRKVGLAKRTDSAKITKKTYTGLSRALKSCKDIGSKKMTAVGV